VLSAQQAKGLEFDATIVVEPEEFVRLPNGLRLLYVALTRSVQRLLVVRSGDMPRVVRQAEAELIFGGGVYQRSGNLVRVVRHDFQAGKDSMDGLPLGALRLCEITAHWLTERFATVSRWKRWQEREQAWFVFPLFATILGIEPDAIRQVSDNFLKGLFVLWLEFLGQ